MKNRANQTRGCVVTSCGGHLAEILDLHEAFSSFQCLYVINNFILLPKILNNKTVFIRHSERDIYFFYNLIEAWNIMRRFRPAFILSAGAGPAIPFFLVARIFNIKTIYIETMTSISSPSLTGRIAYWLVDRFYIRRSELRKHFPKAILFESV